MFRVLRRCRIYFAVPRHGTYQKFGGTERDARAQGGGLDTFPEQNTLGFLGWGTLMTHQTQATLSDHLPWVERKNPPKEVQGRWNSKMETIIPSKGGALARGGHLLHQVERKISNFVFFFYKVPVWAKGKGKGEIRKGKGRKAHRPSIVCNQKRSPSTRSMPVRSGTNRIVTSCAQYSK